MSSTSASVFRHTEPARARRIRATLIETQAAINLQLDWSWYVGRITVESCELFQEARSVFDGTSTVIEPARYRTVFVVDFPADAQSMNAADRLVGVIRGLGGTAVEEI